MSRLLKKYLLFKKKKTCFKSNYLINRASSTKKLLSIPALFSLKLLHDNVFTKQHMS